MNTDQDKDNRKQHISNDDLMKLVMNFRDITVNDLGRWLETKTANNFTIVEIEFITQAFTTFKSIAGSVALFEKQWLAKVRSYSTQD